MSFPQIFTIECFVEYILYLLIHKPEWAEIETPLWFEYAQFQLPTAPIPIVPAEEQNQQIQQLVSVENRNPITNNLTIHMETVTNTNETNLEFFLED